MTMERKLFFRKFGLGENPIHYIVKMNYKNRVLLGRVKGVNRNELTGAINLEVYHFCGDKWPIEPLACLVTVLE